MTIQALPQEMVDRIRALQFTYFPYDIEVYPNIFTVSIQRFDDPTKTRIFEVSPRKNEFRQLLKFLHALKNEGYVMMGFNNNAYDWYILDYAMSLDPNIGAQAIVELIYEKNEAYFAMTRDEQFKVTIWPNSQKILQSDLFKMHHFDNKAKMTSLKMLEFNMNADTIQELPYPAGTFLTEDQMQVLCDYNIHDTDQTGNFGRHSLAMIEAREELGREYNRNMFSHNDMKMGKEFFIMQLEQRIRADICYYKENGERKVRQSPRSSINLGELVFPCVRYNSPQFKTLLQWIKSQNIAETKGVFTDIQYGSFVNDSVVVIGDSLISNGNTIIRGGRAVRINSGEVLSLVDYIDQEEVRKKSTRKNAKPLEETNIGNLHTYLNGFRFDFGTGGLHGAMPSGVVRTTETRSIFAADVKSYYPSIVIHNRLYPEHLGEEFCDIYEEIRERRFSYAKSDPRNGMFKLALNAAGFGDTNNKFSPFYDPKMTMTITINGQLMLAMLAETLTMEIPSIEIIQVNTDGVDVSLDNDDIPQYLAICNEWSDTTGMDLEYAKYHNFYCRDVNNYVAEVAVEYDDDFNPIPEKTYALGEKLKTKGDYSFTPDWHQNHSEKIVAMAAVNFLTTGGDITQFIKSHENKHDFMLRTKIQGRSKLYGLVDLLEGDDENILSLPDWYRMLSMSDRHALETIGVDYIESKNGKLMELTEKQEIAGRRWLDEMNDEFPITVEAQRYQKISRFFVSKEGVRLKKVMPPSVTNGVMKQGWRYIGILKEEKVKVVNDISDFDWDDLDYGYYIDRAVKLASPVSDRRIRSAPRISRKETVYKPPRKKKKS